MLEAPIDDLVAVSSVMVSSIVKVFGLHMRPFQVILDSDVSFMLYSLVLSCLVGFPCSILHLIALVCGVRRWCI